jgi:hypothetical protein
LNPKLPAVRDIILAHRPEGADFVHIDDPAFCHLPVGSAPDSPAIGVSGICEGPGGFNHNQGLRHLEARFDRLIGAPGQDCFNAALEGPYPRSAACVASLSVLDAPATVTPTRPADGANVLMAHLDLMHVSPVPLTLAGPPGAARQRLILNLIGNATFFIADLPSDLPEEAFDWVNRATNARMDDVYLSLFAPRLTTDDWPPSHWESNSSLILFNWTDTPRTVDLDPRWQNTTDLLQPEIRAADRIEIPPNDVRVLVHSAE